MVLQRLPRLATAYLLSLLTCVCVPQQVCRAQPALLPPAQAAQATLPPSASLQPPALPAALTPAPSQPVIADDGYWIISARDCQGQLGPSQCSHFGVWRYDVRGQGRTASLKEFYASLQPQVPVCLMMHGSFVDIDTACRDSLQTNTWLRSGRPGAPLHVVFFTWPSDDTPRVWLPIDVAVLGRRAGRYGFYVAELISMIPDEHPICLVGHSHGARMTVSTLHVLGGGQVDGVQFGGGPYNKHRIRTVLAAAAFDHNWLNPGEMYDRAVYRPEGVLNLVNRRDLALGFYPLHRPLATSAAAARAGFTRGDRQEIGAMSRKIIDFDITARVRAGHIWPHYYGDPDLARAISPYVFFVDPPATTTASTTAARSAVGREIPPALGRKPFGPLESLRSTKWELTSREQQ